MTDVGNATASVPMSVTPLTTTPSFVFGETAEIQPAQPTVSQTVPVPTTVPPLFIDPAVRVKTEDSDFSPSYFTAPKFVATPGSRFAGIPAEEVPCIDENANVPSGNVTSSGQAFLPPEAQKTISEICEQYLRQRGLTSDQAVHQNIGTRNLSNPAPSDFRSSLPTSSGVSDVGGSPPVIPLSPISVASSPHPNGGNGPFSRI